MCEAAGWIASVRASEAAVAAVVMAGPALIAMFYGGAVNCKSVLQWLLEGSGVGRAGVESESPMKLFTYLSRLLY